MYIKLLLLFDVSCEFYADEPKPPNTLIRLSLKSDYRIGDNIEPHDHVHLFISFSSQSSVSIEHFVPVNNEY